METSVKGGSISIFRDSKLIDFYIGDKTVSGSEDLLPKISELLTKNKIPKSEIDVIVVSNGPGSFTGIRIGIATAFALQKSLNCECYGIDMLKALAEKGCSETKAKRIFSAVSHGRNKICWFDFEVKNLNLDSSKNHYFVSDSDFLTKYIIEKIEGENKNESFAICADPFICKTLTDTKELKYRNNINLINADENLSAILGFALLNKNNSLEKPNPLYLNETNFMS